MRKRILLITMLLLGSIIGGIWIKKYFFKSWHPYYQAQLYKEPRPLLMKALAYCKGGEKRALDLGAGAGNDTAYLLHHGWKVWANDADQGALNIIASRHDIQPYIHNVMLMANNFSAMPWNDLPHFDFIYAGYSLPFAKPSEFANIWSHIAHALKPGGIFAGHFFGPEHGGFNWWQKRTMTFFTKESLLNQFEGFQIESFKEFLEKNEQGIWDHSYEVILRKK